MDIDFLKDYLGEGFEVDCPINQPTYLQMYKSQEVMDSYLQFGANNGMKAYSEGKSSLVTSTESLKNLTSSYLEDGYSVVLSMGKGIEMIDIESGFSQKIDAGGHMANVIGVNEDGIIVSSYGGVWLCTYESMNMEVSEVADDFVAVKSNASITVLKITETEQ